MSTTYTVRVGWWDILRGEPVSCGRCPVAHAIRRITGIREVCVGGGSSCFLGDVRTRQRIELPRGVSDFIRDFDFGWSGRFFVSPFTFQLTIP